MRRERPAPTGVSGRRTGDFRRRGPRGGRMTKRVRKAVLPVAGLGTRVLPGAKTTPKNLLNVVDRPILSYIVEEAVAAGIEHFVFIVGRGQGAIEDYFDASPEIEAALEAKGKLDILA